MLLISVSAGTMGSSLEDSSSPVGMSQDINYLHGRQASGDGRFEAAIGHLLKAAQTDSMNPDVYYLLGYSHRKLQKNYQALTY